MDRKPNENCAHFLSQSGLEKVESSDVFIRESSKQKCLESHKKREGTASFIIYEACRQV